MAVQRRALLLAGQDQYAACVRALGPLLWLPLNESNGVIADNAAYTDPPSADLLGGAGSFDSASGWTIDTEWTIAGGHASFLDTGSGSINHAVTNFAPGDTLRIRFVIANSGGQARFSIRAESSDTLVATSNYSDSAYDLHVVSPYTASAIDIRGASAGSTFDLDNWIIRKVGELDGAVSGTTSLAQPGARGPQEACLFDGATSAITIYQRSAINSLDEFTAWMQINPASAGENDQGALLFKNGDFELRFNSASRDLYAMAAYDTTNAETVSSTTLDADTWHTVEMRLDSSNQTISLYVDGQEASYASQTAGVGSRSASTGDLIAGNNDAVNQSFDGLIDELILLDRLLNVSERQTLEAAA